LFYFLFFLGLFRYFFIIFSNLIRFSLICRLAYFRRLFWRCLCFIFLNLRWALVTPFSSNKSFYFVKKRVPKTFFLLLFFCKFLAFLICHFKLLTLLWIWLISTGFTTFFIFYTTATCLTFNFLGLNQVLWFFRNIDVFLWCLNYLYGYLLLLFLLILGYYNFRIDTLCFILLQLRIYFLIFSILKCDHVCYVLTFKLIEFRIIFQT